MIYNNTGDIKTTARNICSVAEVQNYINNYDVSLTGLIQQTITNFSSMAETYCQKVFKAEDFVGIYDGNGSDTLLVYQFPVISLSSLQFRISPQNEWTDFFDLTSSLSANVFIYDDFIQLYNANFFEGKQNIRIKYSAGYTECPGDLKQICIEYVAKTLSESNAPGVGKGLLGVKSQSTGGGTGSENFAFDSLDSRIKKVLDFYKRRMI